MDSAQPAARKKMSSNTKYSIALGVIIVGSVLTSNTCGSVYLDKNNQHAAQACKAFHKTYTTEQYLGFDGALPDYAAEQSLKLMESEIGQATSAKYSTLAQEMEGYAKVMRMTNYHLSRSPINGQVSEMVDADCAKVHGA